MSEPDLSHDLNQYPYPFADNAFDLVEADHVIEHLDQPFRAFREIHRITVDGGILKIRVPHSSRGFMHPEHKCGFDISLPYYFDPAFKGGYQGFRMKLLKVRLTWLAQPTLKRQVLSKAEYNSCLRFWRGRGFSCKPVACDLQSILVLLCRRF